MEATLHALAGILLRAIPTFLIVVFLHFFFKYSFFGPLDRVLKARYEATDGARKRAEEMIGKAAARAAEYEAAMRAARGEIYQAQEQLHQKLEEERKAEAQTARASAEELIRRAKAELAADTEQAKQQLRQQADSLAERIADTVLNRSVA